MSETNMPSDLYAERANKLLLTEEVRGDPRYLETVNRFGHQRARFLADHYGREALSDAFHRTTPIAMDHSKEVLARLDLFNRVAATTEGQSLAEVQRRADDAWAKMSATERAQLASTPGSNSVDIHAVLTRGGGAHKKESGGDTMPGGGQMVNGHWVLPQGNRVNELMTKC